MKKNTKIKSGIIGMALVLGMTLCANAGGPPKEPVEAYLINEDVNIITGLYPREYSLNGNGVVDYMIARQIILSEYNEYWNSVVETREYPLFYWYDENGDGEFEMWVDQKVEGCPCDIYPYQTGSQSQ